MARKHRSLHAKRLTGADDVSEVLTATLERLRRDEFRNLKQYLDQQVGLGPDAAQSFDSWLYGALDYTVREYLRRRYGRAPKTLPEGHPLPSKRDLGTNAVRIPTGVDLAADDAPAMGVTAQLTLGQIFGIVDSEFEPCEARALRMYYGEEKNFAEIAAELGLESAQAADKLVRRLNARLRYRLGRES
jgi:DNA-directed RNA polymerase specialized sigma24 family protein